MLELVNGLDPFEEFVLIHVCFDDGSTFPCNVAFVACVVAHLSLRRLYLGSTRQELFLPWKLDGLSILRSARSLLAWSRCFRLRSDRSPSQLLQLLSGATVIHSLDVDYA